LETNLQKSPIRKNFLLQIFALITLFVISFFFIFWIGSYFEADIFPLENRKTNYTTFHIYIFDKYIDAVIISLLTTLWLCLAIRGKKRIFSAISYGGLTAAALLTNFGPLLDSLVLVSILIIASFFIYHHFSTKKIIHSQTNLLMSFFAIAVLCIAVTGLIATMLTFSPNLWFTGWIKNYAYEIFLLLSSFSPALIFFLVAGTFVKLFTIKRFKELKNQTQKFQITSHKVKQKNKILFMLLFIFLSIFFALLPHQSFINNENELVGADTVDYVKLLNDLRADDQDGLMYQAFVVQNSGDRPVSLIFLSGLLAIFPDNPYQVIDKVPLIFSPLLVLTVFFLTRQLTSNDTVSLLASFLTAISFQPLIGIYSGLYANWLALIFGYLSFVFLLRFLKGPTIINYLAFSVLFFLMMLSHVYTWTVLTFFIGVFLIVSYRLKMFEKKQVALVFLIIVVSIAFDVGKSIMTESQGGIENDLKIASSSISYLNLSMIWSNLTQTSLVYAGGIFGNFLILSLCIYWLLRSNFNQMPNLFLAIFLSIGILPILIGDDLFQTRVLYVISFQIPAAIGLVYLSNQHRGNLLLFATCIWILVMSIQAITNFI